MIVQFVVGIISSSNEAKEISPYWKKIKEYKENKLDNYKKQKNY